MSPQKVILFVDADKDDYYSLCLISAQQYYGIIDVVGIVVDTGFVVNIQDGLLLTKQWLNKIQVATNLDTEDYGFPIKFNLYAGLPRPAFLDNRLFPKIWTNSFVSAMKTIYDITLPNFNYITNEFTDEVVETGAPSVNILFAEISNFHDKSILSLTTGPATSLATGLNKFPFLSSKISSIYSMASNYLVPGNTPKADSDYADITLPSPYLDYSGEYNAFMNPYALQRLTSSVQNDIDVNIVPLDCTNYANLLPSTVDELKAIAEPFLYYSKNLWVNNVCDYFISLVATTLVTENSPLYLWDLCATNIALGSNVDQFYILGTPIVETSGKIKQYSYGSNDKVKIYMSLSYQKLLVNSIRIIFNDVAYKV
jgi:inosine-uridine nucleoside N-ribohydrolase